MFPAELLGFRALDGLRRASWSGVEMAGFSGLGGRAAHA